MAVKYLRWPDGSVGVQTMEAPLRGYTRRGGPAPDPAVMMSARPGAVEITEDEYAAARGQVRGEVADMRATARAEEAQARSEDYQALVDAGIPEATARRLTGYREG